LVPLSRIASIAALAILIFTHPGGTSCCAIRVTWLSGAGPLTRPAQGLRGRPGKRDGRRSDGSSSELSATHPEQPRASRDS
jgi:hypothetical protein